jgi:hypothetical protein
MERAAQRPGRAWLGHGGSHMVQVLLVLAGMGLLLVVALVVLVPMHLRDLDRPGA